MSPQPKLWLMADLALASPENGLSLTDTEMKNDPGTSNIDSQCILELKDVTLRFGGVVALKNVTMDVRNNEILALIGPNGAGKSCILNCISGFTTPQAGTILFKGQSLMNQPSHRRSSSGIGRTFQGVKLLPDMSVEDNILVGRHSLMRTNIFQDFAYWPYAARNRRKHKQDIRGILELLDLEQYTDTPVSSLSYGLRKKVDLGRALATEPQILLMDEPMAGMNSEEKHHMAELIEKIHHSRNIPILIIEHDIKIVMSLAHRITVLDWGQILATGQPDEIKLNPKVIAAYLGVEEQEEEIEVAA